MPRRAASITQADIARAIRAMRAAGYVDVRVVFKDGTVIVEAAPSSGEVRTDRASAYHSERIVVL